MTGLLSGCRSTSLGVKERRGIKWGCFPVIVSYYCSVPDGKDMSVAKHGAVERTPYTWCMTMMDGIWNLWCSRTKIL